MALVEIGKNHKEDIAKLKKRLAKLEKTSGPGATLKLKVEGEKDDSYNHKLDTLKKRLQELEKKSGSRKVAKKPIKRPAKKPGKDDLKKHKEDIRKLKDKLGKLEKKKRNATIRPTLNFKSSISRLNKNIETILELLTKAGDEAGSAQEDSPVVEKLDLLLKQNEKIAQGILTVADMIKERFDKEKKESDNLQPSINDVSEEFSSRLDTVPNPVHQPLNINVRQENSYIEPQMSPAPVQMPQAPNEPIGSGLFESPTEGFQASQQTGGTDSFQGYHDNDFNRFAQPSDDSIEPIVPANFSQTPKKMGENMPSFDSLPGQEEDQYDMPSFPSPPPLEENIKNSSGDMDFGRNNAPEFKPDMFPPPPGPANLQMPPGGFGQQPPDFTAKPIHFGQDFRPIQPNTAPIPPSGDRQKLKLRPFDNENSQ